jgi:threonyl-tRNA synthetase
MAEQMLEDVANKHNLMARRMEGEAAIYGPKLDFMFKDALGRETQLATIQLDFAMPKRFGLTYTDEAGVAKTPVMIHRAILGSFERFIMLLIEHYAGRFPLWLSPEQLRIISVNQEESIVAFADSLAAKAKEAGIRVTVDNGNESVGKKIRSSEIWKVPYTLVIGNKEVTEGRVTPRVRTDLAVDNREEQSFEIDQFMTSVANEIRGRVSKSSL